MALRHKGIFETQNYWNDYDIQQVIGLADLSTEKITSEEVIRRSVVIGRRILLKMSDDITMVCGPSGEKDIPRIDRAIQRLSLRMSVFDQTPFEHLFHALHAKHSLWDTLLRRKTPLSVANQFYEELFADNTKHWSPYFLEGWKEDSKSVFQHELFKKKNVTIFYRSDDLINSIYCQQ